MTQVSEEVSPVHDIQEVNLPGHRLRARREVGRMSLEEVAHHLHLDVQIITALEQDNYDRLPAPIYVCGYLRAYARLLKLPETEIVGAYTRGKEINSALIPENINILPAKSPINPALFKNVLVLVLVVIVVAGIVWILDEADLFGNNIPVDRKVDVPLAVPQESSAQPETTLPDEPAVSTDVVSAPEPEPDLIPPSTQEIEKKIAQQAQQPVAKPENVVTGGAKKADADLYLIFREDSWVEVTDSDDVRHAYRLMKLGSELYVVGKAPYKILLGKADGVDVIYQGKLFDHSRFHRDDVAYFRVGSSE